MILDHWQANMDIQVIANAESAAYYVCAYLCKSETEDLKFALRNVLNNLPNNLPQRNRLLRIGCCVLKTRKLSAQEAAYRLSDLNLICSTRTVMFLNTKPQKCRFKVLKSKEERDHLPENSTDIFYTNIKDYYRARPKDMEQYCLYKFAQWFIKCDEPKSSQLNTGKRKAEKRIQLIKPFQDTFMRRRVKFVIIRLPKLSISSDDYFYSLLMSFLPHRNENDI